jgi:hypothetical protein
VCVAGEANLKIAALDKKVVVQADSLPRLNELPAPDLYHDGKKTLNR